MKYKVLQIHTEVIDERIVNSMKRAKQIKEKFEDNGCGQCQVTIEKVKK
jgi:hypothetical protein